MRKAIGIGLVLMVVLAFAGAALAGSGSGRYEWRFSFSAVDPNVQVAANPTNLGTLYLWYQGCNSVPGGAGMAAADFGIAVSGGWQFLSFTTEPTSGFLNAGSGANLLLAVGGCPAGPEVVGSVSVFTPSDGALKLGKSNNNIAVVLDCNDAPQGSWSWPDDMLFVGARSSGFGGTAQGFGKGCTVDPVDPATWGSIKSLYR